MSKVFRDVLPILALMILTGSCYGQTAGPKGGAPPTGFNGIARQVRAFDNFKLANTILDKLGLSADQKAKVAVLEAKAKDDIKALRKDTKPTDTSDEKKARRKRLLALNKQFRDDLLAILNPAQQTDFKAKMKAEMDNIRKALRAMRARVATPTTPLSTPKTGSGTPPPKN